MIRKSGDRFSGKIMRQQRSVRRPGVFPALVAAALALLLAGCGDRSGDPAAGGNAAAPLAQIRAPNGDWTQIVAATPEGGFRMGNPAAPVKLVEYGSVGCHICANFSREGSAPLRDTYVKSGRVSWEFRPYLLFPSDPGMAMLLRCRGPEPFFQLLDQLYAGQKDWMARLQAISPAAQAQLQSLPPQERATALVRLAGIDRFFQVRGMPAGRVAACLADPQALKDLTALTERGNQEGVTGTPTFFINGRQVPNTSSWEALEPALRAAAR
jgi:protein-disulfide isomerase